MQTYTLKFTHSVNIADIEAALALVGEFKLTAKRPPMPKAEKEFCEPLTVYKDGEPVRELNPIEVAKAIRKLQLESDSRARADGRNKNMFTIGQRCKTTAQYVEAFCIRLNHRKAEYMLNGEMVRA